MTSYPITQAELSTLLYCLEGQAVDFQYEDDSASDFHSVFNKLEALADKTPDPQQLDQLVATISLINHDNDSH